jgi:hypothetical protein
VRRANERTVPGSLTGDRDMRKRAWGKALTNERKYPHVVELTITADGLDVALGRRIIEFHKSRHIQPRHGRRIVRQGKIYYRWCFSDPVSARAFIEEFGGALCETII